VIGGLGLNSFWHLWRFYMVGRATVTGPFGNMQTISISFFVSLWILIPLALIKFLVPSLRFHTMALFGIPAILVLMNELSGRSMLKLVLDFLLIIVLVLWVLIDNTYGSFDSVLPTEKAIPYVISELIAIFQISLAILTFVIATFGFNFASAYLEKYYHLDIGQRTIWWFSLMTIYLTIGILLFITAHAWLTAIKLRQTL